MLASGVRVGSRCVPLNEQNLRFVLIGHNRRIYPLTVQTYSPSSPTDFFDVFDFKGLKVSLRYKEINRIKIGYG